MSSTLLGFPHRRPLQNLQKKHSFRQATPTILVALVHQSNQHIVSQTEKNNKTAISEDCSKQRSTTSETTCRHIDKDG